ncbi:nicotinamide-nucleotide amidase [Candidatus Nitrotoga sp. M5]|uniref:nicotinamide-nucleotide amidase n=1 Tax=Candidatus Nitrotoga sp. M5 TaxID=2890409 RepID=UPI001EF3A30C|nr:nicotinamide-nucleotide amidase [Candidatus Nitrotoga sp. M5]CAH1385968.1 NMN aminohydrolase [Candidatus Nitrotoga sp. M5]
MLVSREVENMAIQIGSALKSYGYMLATAESCTGGAVATAVTDIAGSSEWFERGFVTYSNEAKREMLGVAQETLTSYGAVSEAVVREMVTGTLYHSHAQIALAVSGIAGPAGGMPDKPVGTVWFAWGVKGGQCIVRLHHFSGDRAEIRMQSVCIAFQGVLELLNQVTEVA